MCSLLFLSSYLSGALCLAYFKQQLCFCICGLVYSRARGCGEIVPPVKTRASMRITNNHEPWLPRGSRMCFLCWEADLGRSLGSLASPAYLSSSRLMRDPAPYPPKQGSRQHLRLTSDLHFHGQNAHPRGPCPTSAQVVEGQVACRTQPECMCLSAAVRGFTAQGPGVSQWPHHCPRGSFTWTRACHQLTEGGAVGRDGSQLAELTPE